MGYRSIRISDISGEEIPSDQVVTVILKSGGGKGRAIDATAEELKAIKELTNVFELELKFPDGTAKKVLTTEKDFYAVVPREVVEKADSSRGRRKGFRPSTGS